MKTLTAARAKASLLGLIDQVGKSHKPVRITGGRHDGVLMSQEDFQAMQETIYLLNVPGMKESLRKAKRAPPKAYSIKRPW